jgi:hypothetical protein
VQAPITIRAWIGADGYGAATFASPVTYKAVVDTTRKDIAGASGQVLAVVATITIIGDVRPNGAPGRIEPVDPRDIVTLSDGRTGPIVSAPNSVMDPGTGRGFIHEIMIGAA